MTAVQTDLRQAWHLRLTDLRKELLAPARAIRNSGELLYEEAEIGGDDAIIADLAEIRSSCRELDARVEQLLDPGRARELFDASTLPRPRVSCAMT